MVDAWTQSEGPLGGLPAGRLPSSIEAGLVVVLVHVRVAAPAQRRAVPILAPRASIAVLVVVLVPVQVAAPADRRAIPTIASTAAGPASTALLVVAPADRRAIPTTASTAAGPASRRVDRRPKR